MIIGIREGEREREREREIERQRERERERERVELVTNHLRVMFIICLM